MKDNQDHFDVLRKIQKKPESTQRELAEVLGFSLGKLNYCLKALKNKGLIKMKNFGRNPNKLNYIYTGMQIIKPEVFNGLSEEVFSINRIWDKLIQSNELYGMESNINFLHVTTLDIYKRLLEKYFKH